MAITLLVKVKGGPGSGNWGHAGRPGMVGGSGGTGEAAPRKMSKEEVDASFYHRAGANTDAILESRVIIGSEDNFAPYIHRGWHGSVEDQVIAFSVPKEQLRDFRFTLTNEVASNIRDTKLSDLGVKVVLYDRLAKLYYDMTGLYESGIRTEAGLLDAWQRLHNDNSGVID